MGVFLLIILVVVPAVLLLEGWLFMVAIGMIHAEWLTMMPTSDVLVLALAGGYQTFTVTRSANGIEKSHAAETTVALVRPLTLAL